MQTSSHLVRPLLRGIVVFLAAVVSLAAVAQPAPKAKTLSLAKSPIAMIDYTNLTFTVTEKGTNLVLFITPETRFFKEGKYATSRDFKVGDEIHGTLKLGEADRHEAVRLYLGAAPKGKAPSGATKAKPAGKGAKKPAGKPAAPSTETPAEKPATPPPADSTPSNAPQS
jgi:hypothetical protein